LKKKKDGNQVNANQDPATRQIPSLHRPIKVFVHPNDFADPAKKSLAGLIKIVLEGESASERKRDRAERIA
jgi:hypothetical protein